VGADSLRRNPSDILKCPAESFGGSQPTVGAPRQPERPRQTPTTRSAGAICNDVAFSFAHVQLSRLREWWQRENQRALGHRLLMDCVLPGGAAEPAAADWAQGFARQNDLLANELEQLLPILEDYPSLEDRLEDTGVLGVEPARRLGAVGFELPPPRAVSVCGDPTRPCAQARCGYRE
jgi:hypothetical protein